MKKKKEVSISQALTTLTAIAEMDAGGGHSFLSLPEIEALPPLHGRISPIEDIAEWISVERVAEIFQVILDYVQSKVDAPDTIKGIMVLVGEAAKKMDHFTDIFEDKSEKSVTQLIEYKRLQEFYTKKIAKQIDPSTLSRWIVGLTMGRTEERKPRSLRAEKSEHVFVDLEMVKKDTEYELLLVRKADGTRFYNPRLLRNIQLVCDFGNFTDEKKDFLASIETWREELCNQLAINLLKSLHLSIVRFYQEGSRYKDRDTVAALGKAVMALFLAANPKSLQADSDKKSASGYFSDFLLYLREALSTRYYQKLLAYPPKEGQILSCCILAVTQDFCRGLYLHLNVMEQLSPRVHQLLKEAATLLPLHVNSAGEQRGFAWSRIARDYAEILKSGQLHSTGPLKRILEALQEGRQPFYDPLLYFNFPHHLFSVRAGERDHTFLRLPTPTRQVTINKAVVNDEFKSFLLSHDIHNEASNHLLVNLQDRISWREIARSHVLEQLQNSAEFKPHLTVVTLATDTPFYNQAGEYEHLESADEFIKAFKEEFKSEAGGFYFPDAIKESIVPQFTTAIIDAVHRAFFLNSRFLSLKERHSFISLVYLFLELKIIEITSPKTISLTCKDAIDTGEAASVMMLLFLKLLQEEKLSEEEMEYVEAIIYGPALLVRERAILPNPFNRILEALQIVERIKDKMGFSSFQKQVELNLSPLFKQDFIHAKVTIPVRPSVEETEKAA